MKIVFQNKTFQIPEESGTVEDIYRSVSSLLRISPTDFYLVSNGKKITSTSSSTSLNVILRLPGGKGGFGSMLRAIGAQIEKTTNREACRDLSGRRLRDINEEQRLKKWVAQQAEREKEAKEKKKKKLEKLLEEPKYEFKDEAYEKERSALPEKVEDAVLKGLEASCSTKRKGDGKQTSVVKKKPKLWLDEDLDEDISSSDSESEEKPSILKDASPKSNESTSRDEEHSTQDAKSEETTEGQGKGKEAESSTEQVQTNTNNQ